MVDYATLPYIGIGLDTRPLTEALAVHLFRRISVGASPDLIQSVVGRPAYEVVHELVDEAIALPLPSDPIWSNQYDFPFFERVEQRQELKEKSLTYLCDHGLREKMAMFWYNHFGTNIRVHERPSFTHRALQLYRSKGLGDFFELLSDTGIGLDMLRFLNGYQSHRDSPNENYARELLELFTMSKFDLDGNENYQEEDIIEIARSLTGWRIDFEDLTVSFISYFWDNRHKTIFGHKKKFDYFDVIDLLKSERSFQIAQYICTKIYRLFVYKGLNRSIINSLTFATVVKKLLRSRHFFHDASHGVQIKSPAEMFTIALKEAEYDLAPSQGHEGLFMRLVDSCEIAGQRILEPPDVSGYQGHREWLSTTALPNRWDLLEKILKGKYFDVKKQDLSPWAARLSGYSTDPSIIVSKLSAFIFPRIPEQEILNIRRRQTSPRLSVCRLSFPRIPLGLNMRRNSIDAEQQNGRRGETLSDGIAHAKDHQNWSRRNFLSSIGLLAAGSPFRLGAGMVRPLYEQNSLARNLLDLETDRVLVLLQIKGGWDGLNVVVPFSNSTYYSERPILSVKSGGYHDLGGGLGLNSDLNDLLPSWNDGNMAIVQGVGYPDSSLSHFDGTDYWISALPGEEASTGWIGRTLDKLHPDFADSPPLSPLAVEISAASSQLFFNSDQNLGMTLRNPNEFYRIAQSGGVYDLAGVSNDAYGDELSFIRQVANFSVRYASNIRNAANLGRNDVTYPQFALAENLSIVAKLIKGGLGSKIYKVQLDGFDTHGNQDSRLPALLDELGQSLKAFFEDLKFGDCDQKTLLMTFSEFGRRVKENYSNGTDHGTSAPLFLLGGDDTVSGGFVGEMPSLDDLDSRGNLHVSTDFRSVYGSILNQWLGVSCSTNVEVLDFEGQELGLVKNPDPAVAGCALPVELASFDAEILTDGKVTLYWTTLSELNNSGFEVEQLFLDGIVEDIWTTVGFVEGFGNSHSLQTYQFVAGVAEAGNYRYRLKQIDYNGVFQYTNRVEIFVDLPKSIARLEFYPNPWVDQAIIEFSTKKRQKVKIELFDQLGRSVRQLFDDVVRVDSATRLPISSIGLSTGSYFLSVVGEEFSMSRKVILSK